MYLDFWLPLWLHSLDIILLYPFSFIFHVSRTIELTHFIQRRCDEQQNEMKPINVWINEGAHDRRSKSIYHWIIIIITLCVILVGLKSIWTWWTEWRWKKEGNERVRKKGRPMNTKGNERAHAHIHSYTRVLNKQGLYFAVCTHFPKIIIFGTMKGENEKCWREH